MFLFKDIAPLQVFLAGKRENGVHIGFIPTMGALHEGHLSLIRSAKSNGQLAVCSIFVNPTQFNQQEDYDKYPRNLEKDLGLLMDAGCDVLFHPELDTMYPNRGGITEEVNFGLITSSLEGAFRPGHFNGVIEIVKRLFEIIKPESAYFGQKDFQQCAVVARLIAHYGFPVKLVTAPIIRETTGLALSSRNSRLSDQQRSDALILFRTLRKMAAELANAPFEGLISNATKEINEKLKVEYIAIVDAASLEPLSHYEKGRKAAILVAAWCGAVRLIDNLIVTE